MSGAEAIILQPVRTGFPCFGAALAGYVEAVLDDDAEKNRFCPPSPYSDAVTDWGRMQVFGGLATRAFGSHPDLKSWPAQVSLNPARIPPGMASSPELPPVTGRLRSAVGPAMAKMAQFAGMW